MRLIDLDISPAPEHDHSSDQGRISRSALLRLMVAYLFPAILDGKPRLMMLLEHDAKELLAADGIPVPMGVLTTTADIDLPATLHGPWMVKGQIPTGGRGKAGGIKRADTIVELRQRLGSLLGKTVKGQVIRTCRIEQCVRGTECYLSVSLDLAQGRLRVLLSSEGGVDIEAHAERGSLLATDVANDGRDAIAAARRLADTIASPARETIVHAAERLITEFFAFEATLLEVNPLFIRPDGSWSAGDIKLVIDDNALVRQPRLCDLIRQRADDYPEMALKLDHGFDFVVVDPDGEIGLVTTGAGLSMQMIDELAERGHPAFNFCDIRTGQLRGDPTRLINVFRWIAAGRNVRSVLINFFAGITHLGEVAKLLVTALNAVPELRVPVTARLIGNGYDEAIAVFASAGHPLKVEPDLDRAIELALAPLTGARP
jgi:succinyl-CoA synthetase beta subunit